MALVDKASVMPKPDRVVGLPLTLVHAGVTVTAAPMAVTLPLASTVNGVCAVAELLYAPGDQVAEGAPLLRLSVD